MQQASYHSCRKFWPLSLFPGFQICLALRHLNGLAGYELFNVVNVETYRIKPQHLIFWILPNHIRYAVKQLLVVDHKVWWIRSLKAWQLVTKAPATNLQRPRPLAAGQKKQNGESHCEGGGGASWMIHFPNFSCLGLFQKSFRKNCLILCPVSFFCEWRVVMDHTYETIFYSQYFYTTKTYIVFKKIEIFPQTKSPAVKNDGTINHPCENNPTFTFLWILRLFLFVCLFVCLFVFLSKTAVFFLRRWGDDVTFYDASIVSNVEVGLFEGRSSVTYTWKEVDPEFSTWKTQCANQFFKQQWLVFWGQNWWKFTAICFFR